MNDEPRKRIPATVWFIGLPCSGKTTLSEALYRTPTTIHLDGDILRKGLCKDLGFSAKDRRENLRRAAEVCKIMNEWGHNATAAFITPTKALRQQVRDIIDNVVMVYVKCPIEVCEERDVKGMYAKARTGEIKDFTGISDPFEEADDDADIILDTSELTVAECMDILGREIPKYWRGYC